MKSTVVAVCALAIVAGSGLPSAGAASSPGDDRASRGKAAPTVVVRWNETTLEAIRRARLGPPIVARALAIVHTCMYDAWAAYDRKAVGTQLGDALRRPRTNGRRSTDGKP